MIKTVSDPVHPDEETAEDLLDPLTLTQIQDKNPEILETLLSTYVLDNRDEYRNGEAKVMPGSLFAAQAQSTSKPKPEVTRKHIIFAVDDYIAGGSESVETESVEDDSVDYSASAEIPASFDFTKVIPRSQKAKEIQKRRVKEKAEVFTPTWVCNLQNNLIDDDLIIGDNVSVAFNTLSEDQKVWEPSSGAVDLTDYAVKRDVTMNLAAITYIHENRLEITMGEAPYLVSPYDTVSGSYLPVRDDQGRYQRIGLLDRKLRIVNEYIDRLGKVDEMEGNKALWESLVYGAFCSTYGYEWQGDNLLLARLNALNTYRDYYYDRWEAEPTSEDLHQIAIIISMNFWQMDGLKAIVPLSESDSYEKNPEKSTGFYDGIVPVVSFKHGILSAQVAYEGKSLDALLNISPDLEWTPFEEVMGAWLKEKAKKKPAKKKK